MLIYSEGNDAYLVFNSYRSRAGDGKGRFAYISKLNNAWDDIVPESDPNSLANTTAVMEGLWLFKRQGTYFLFGSHLTGCKLPEPRVFAHRLSIVGCHRRRAER
jgi:hypothetical protein